MVPPPSVLPHPFGDSSRSGDARAQFTELVGSSGGGTLGAAIGQAVEASAAACTPFSSPPPLALLPLSSPPQIPAGGVDFSTVLGLARVSSGWPCQPCWPGTKWAHGPMPGPLVEPVGGHGLARWWRSAGPSTARSWQGLAGPVPGQVRLPVWTSIAKIGLLCFEHNIMPVFPQAPAT